MDYTKKLLEVRDLHKAYSKEGVPTKALNGITFDVLNGEYLGIMGASGSGKTTLLNCIATVIKPTSGQILLSGANISAFDGAKLAEYRGNRIGYLFQDFALLDNLTGRENILLPLSIHNIDISIAEKRLNDIAGFLGITDVLSKFPAQMSGGQKQRVAAARSLISDPDIILADEPTGALDTKAARLLMEKLREVNQSQERTILMVTHDPTIGVIRGQGLDEPHIQRQFPPVVGNAQHIVHMGVNPTGTDFLGPFRQPLYHLFLDLGRFNDFRVEVGLWHGEFEHIRRLDVRHPFESGHQLRQVIKLGKPCPGTITGAFGVEFVKILFVDFLN